MASRTKITVRMAEWRVVSQRIWKLEIGIGIWEHKIIIFVHAYALHCCRLLIVHIILLLVNRLLIVKYVFLEHMDKFFMNKLLGQTQKEASRLFWSSLWNETSDPTLEPRSNLCSNYLRHYLNKENLENHQAFKYWAAAKFKVWSQSHHHSKSY